tara:strand:+ start:281 stop:397 length:117 start_codon:yes stop_codon:yes gene_type:complete
MAEFIARMAYFIAGWGVSFIVFLLGYLLVLAWVGSRRP